jgi:hypothetical protein
MSNNRTKPIHPSWDEVLPNFNSEFEVNGRFPHSQNSFLKWCKSFGVEIDAANFSTLKTKPLGQFTKVAILAWVAQRPVEAVVKRKSFGEKLRKAKEVKGE